MRPATRRTFLALLGTVALGGGAGCIGGPAANSPGEDSSPESTTTESPDRTPTSTPTASEPPSGPIRCEGAPVSAKATVTDDPGYDDNMEYFSGNETVRVVLARSGDEPLSFEDWSFERWATIETADVAQPRAVEVTAERLGTDRFGSGVGRPPESVRTNGLVVRLYLTSRVQDGEVVRTPTRSLSQLVGKAPRSVESTVTLEGDSYTRSVPVFAEHSRVGFSVGGGGGAR